MKVCRSLGATQSKVLNYMNSGDVTGDMGSVVGYASCVFYGEK
jgi:AmmeMemoRadiSam system protein B